MAAAFSGLFGDELTPNAANFIGTLAYNKRLLLLPQISEQFVALKAQQEQTVNVEVTSAYELSEAESRAISTSFCKKIVTGSEIEFKRRCRSIRWRCSESRWHGL